METLAVRHPRFPLLRMVDAAEEAPTTPMVAREETVVLVAVAADTRQAGRQEGTAVLTAETALPADMAALPEQDKERQQKRSVLVLLTLAAVAAVVFLAELAALSAVETVASRLSQILAVAVEVTALQTVPVVEAAEAIQQTLLLL